MGLWGGLLLAGCGMQRVPEAVGRPAAVGSPAAVGPSLSIGGPAKAGDFGETGGEIPPDQPPTHPSNKPTIIHSLLGVAQGEEPGGEVGPGGFGAKPPSNVGTALYDPLAHDAEWLPDLVRRDTYVLLGRDGTE